MILTHLGRSNECYACKYVFELIFCVCARCQVLEAVLMQTYQCSFINSTNRPLLYALEHKHIHMHKLYTCQVHAHTKRHATTDAQMMI